MKQFLLSLLTCGICACGFAQIDTSNKINPGNSDKWKIAEKWEIIPQPEKGMKNHQGSLDLGFGNDSVYKNSAWMSWTILILSPSPSITLNGKDYQKSFRAQEITYPLREGEYNLKLNGVPLEKLPIEDSKKTRIKTGKLKIRYTHYYSTVSKWEILKDTIHPLTNDILYKYIYTTGDQKAVITLPVGTYQLRFYSVYPKHTITISDQDITTVEVPVGKLTIISDRKTWRLFDNEVAVTKPYIQGGNSSGWDVKDIFIPFGNYQIRYSDYSGTVVKNVTITSNSQEIRIPQ